MRFLHMPISCLGEQLGMLWKTMCTPCHLIKVVCTFSNLINKLVKYHHVLVLNHSFRPLWEKQHQKLAASSTKNNHHVSLFFATFAINTSCIDILWLIHCSYRSWERWTMRSEHGCCSLSPERVACLWEALPSSWVNLLWQEHSNYILKINK